MARVLTGDMFVTTKMIVEMVLMKPVVVCNKQVMVKSANTCVIVANGIFSGLSSTRVVTMANNDLR